MTRFTHLPRALALCSLVTLLPACGTAMAAPGWPTEKEARALQDRPTSDVLAAARAGDSTVSVGRHGVVQVGIDGRSFVQASAVPTRTTLTSVSFIDPQQGWAVGFDGVILHTLDGGRRWTLQRQHYGSDDVLLGVAFESATRGIAVGLFGLILETFNGGSTWTRRALDGRDVADRHLYSVVRVGNGVLIITAEGGMVLRSTDAGASWQAINTGVKASLWAGAAREGKVVAAGLRGTSVISHDAGLTWRKLATGTSSAITAAAYGPDGTLFLGTASGLVLASADGGHSFSTSKLKGSDAITALVPRAEGLVAFPLPRVQQGGTK